METKFNFKSQICTSRSQSERLLSLGLKKETADMTHHYLHSTDSYELKDIEFSRIMHLQELVNKKPVLGRNGDELYAKDIPAWSLHRLLCLYGADYTIKEVYNNAEECYGMLICAIEIAIEDGDFNKEYLV